MTAIVEIQQLRKEYSSRGRGSIVAVNDLNLTIGQPGTVHGFLGPNGSGKTTTIRCLLGLVRPTAGNARVFGADSRTEFHAVADRVGAIVENPKLFPNFSGRKNLQLLATLGRIEQRRVDEVLDIVRLGDRGDDTFESYSLGMKQRLAIAAALLKDPELLILDEPANGLDPAGIAEMRVLIRTIADQGKAILVSSHQLAEIEHVCDEVTIIANGELIRSGSLDHVRDADGVERVIVSIPQREEAMAVLRAAGMTVSAMANAADFTIEAPKTDAGRINQILAEQGLFLEGLRADRATLESAFLSLTGTSDGDRGGKTRIHNDQREAQS